MYIIIYYKQFVVCNSIEIFENKKQGFAQTFLVIYSGDLAMKL